GSFSHTKWTNEGQWAGAASIADFYGWSGDYAQPQWSRTAGKPETTREQGVYMATRLNLRDDLKLLAGSRVASYKKEQLQKSGVVVPYLGLVYDL
ncbi:MAG: TonB-dependent siderophore receptor, partial [Stenotrophomonas sp.]